MPKVLAMREVGNGADAGLIAANCELIKERDQLREQLQTLIKPGVPSAYGVLDGEHRRLVADLAAANAIIADQKRQVGALRTRAQLAEGNAAIAVETCKQLREQLQELHAAGGAADEYRQLAADHKLAMTGIERLRVSYDAAVAENRKLQEICEKGRQEHARLREKLHALEAQQEERDILNCAWRPLAHGNAANWPTVDGDGKPLERIGDGYHYAHGNGDVSALVGEPATPVPFLGPRECPKHGKWGCMCPREPEPKGPAVRRGTGRNVKVEM
jgi:hypothetical protein